ncbi:flagellar basal body rod protein FlgB [Nisaea denitrificans]|uniref:flagellar basal body rod protein FlgB n=1 Tax=Nisaea denitrificans TaxID=390877 RepID=UPI0004022E97|nr:flagellar basal body rod protein FlgB [Nisaea denitrificans]
MSITNLTLMNMAQHKLNWLSERQSVLAQNIANADSPSYRSQDLTPINFKREVEQVIKLPVAVTEGSHMTGTTPRNDFRIDKTGYKDVYEASPNGNGVVLEEQMIAVQDTKLQYDLALNLYNKQIGMFRTALGGGGAR